MRRILETAEGHNHSLWFRLRFLNDFSECDWTVPSFGRLLCVHMCILYLSVHVLYLAIISYYILITTGQKKSNTVVMHVASGIILMNSNLPSIVQLQVLRQMSLIITFICKMKILPLECGNF